MARSSRSLLAPALSEFSRRYPNIRFEVTITSARQAVEAVNAAQADMALTLFAPPMSDAQGRDALRNRIRPYRFGTACRGGSQGDHASRNLPAIRLALPEKSFGFRQSFDALVERQGLTIEPVFTASALEMLKELVLSDTAITLLPALSVRREVEAGLLVAIPLASESSIRTHADLSIAPDRQLSFAAGKFIEFIENFMRTKLKSR